MEPAVEVMDEPMNDLRMSENDFSTKSLVIGYDDVRRRSGFSLPSLRIAIGSESRYEPYM